MMIGGIPNVGKSTIINCLRAREEDIKHNRKSGAKVGAVPCITKSMNGFKVMTNPVTYLIDTPGIIQPKIHNNEDGLRLCVTGTIRDGIVDIDTCADYLLYKLNLNRNNAYVRNYGLRQPTNNISDVLKAVENKYRLNNAHNITAKFLKDYREGELGNMTLDGTPKREIKRYLRTKMKIE